ncbi:hypothetical protein Slala04_12240 [Streptomyces lavendulae subsp. lavendulae]|nr:hypothetical protein Slala04_12240 [Streptomyces lavendulae subsp. lavendulae]
MRSHTKMHLKPRIGHLRLDRLNVGHLIEMFGPIADENEAIAAVRVRGAGAPLITLIWPATSGPLRSAKRRAHRPSR